MTALQVRTPLRKFALPTVATQLTFSFPTRAPEASASGLVKANRSPSAIERRLCVLVLRTCLNVEPLSSSLKVIVVGAAACACASESGEPAIVKNATDATASPATTIADIAIRDPGAPPSRRRACTPRMIAAMPSGTPVLKPPPGTTSHVTTTPGTDRMASTSARPGRAGAGGSRSIAGRTDWADMAAPREVRVSHDTPSDTARRHPDEH